MAMRMVMRIDPVDESAEISWWAANRARLNQAIVAFNAWEQSGSEAPADLALMREKARLAREFAEGADFAHWQIKILDTIDRRLESRRNELGFALSELTLADGRPPELIEPLDPKTGVEWQESNRAMLNELIHESARWQEAGAKDSEAGALIALKAEELRSRAESLSLARWQTELLDKMIDRLGGVREPRASLGF